MIEFKCSECGKGLEIDANQEGHKIICPHCNKATALPEVNLPPFAIVCNNCHTELDVSPLMGGKLVSCTKCGSMVLVPSLGSEGGGKGCLGAVVFLGLLFGAGLTYFIT